MSDLTYYQEVTLIEQPEISLGFIWAKLYMQLHLALADIRTKKGISNIGVSFPEYQKSASKFPLGTKLRVFGVSKECLEELNLVEWLSRLSDYVHVMKEPRKIPSRLVKSYAIFSRKEVKSGAERLARRRVKRDPSMTYEEALRRASMVVRECNLPYVNIRSLTSNHSFKLFIEKTELDQAEGPLEFTSYGLSKGSAVPIF